MQSLSDEQPSPVVSRWRDVGVYLTTPIDRPIFEDLLNDLRGEYQPATTMEALLLEELAGLMWEHQQWRLLKRSLILSWKKAILRRLVDKGLSTLEVTHPIIYDRFKDDIYPLVGGYVEGQVSTRDVARQALGLMRISDQKIDHEVYLLHGGELLILERMTSVFEQRRAAMLQSLNQCQARRAARLTLPGTDADPV